MKFPSQLAVATSMLAMSFCLSVPAHAQRAPSGSTKQVEQPQQQPAQAGPKRNYTKTALKTFQELQNAVNANDTATFPAKLAAAQALAQTADDRYFVAQMQFTMAQKAGDEAGLRRAIDAMIRSGGASAEELPKLQRGLGSLAAKAKDYPAAIAAYQAVAKSNPNDLAVLSDLAIMHREQRQYPQAIALLEQSIAASKAAGQKPAENTYRLALQTALDGKVQSKIVPLTREWVAAYPSQKSWSDALNIYRQTVEADDDATLDTFRLMRATKSLDRSNEYIALADTLARGRFYAEARDVVNEGVRAGKFPASNASAAAILKEVSGRIAGDRTALAGLEGRARSEATGGFALKIAEGYYGHGDYAKAAEFYRLALQKGSVDAGLANTRLGMSLAQAGRKAEAETALRAVTGPRADLAGLWLLWLNQRV
jgi:tetratricopeptide (TPR) repeat protein